MKCLKKINSTNFNKRKDIVYDRFVLAQSYQRAAIILIDDVIKNNDENIYIESLNNKEEYYEMDKKAPPMIHNMQSLILPILFCTYQFIEQIIKGLAIYVLMKNILIKLISYI